jgi:hypothetical protein
MGGDADLASAKRERRRPVLADCGTSRRGAGLSITPTIAMLVSGKDQKQPRIEGGMDAARASAVSRSIGASLGNGGRSGTTRLVRSLGVCYDFETENEMLSISHAKSISPNRHQGNGRSHKIQSINDLRARARRQERNK